AHVECAHSVSDGLSRVFTLLPTCVILLTDRLPAETTRFVRLLQAEIPSCITLVAGDHPPLDIADASDALRVGNCVLSSAELGELVGRVTASLRTGRSGSGTAPQPLTRSVSRALDYLHGHLGDGLTVTHLAAAAGVSGSHLAHRFRAE